MSQFTLRDVLQAVAAEWQLAPVFLEHACRAWLENLCISADALLPGEAAHLDVATPAVLLRMVNERTIDQDFEAETFEVLVWLVQGSTVQARVLDALEVPLRLFISDQPIDSRPRDVERNGASFGEPSFFRTLVESDQDAFLLSPIEVLET